MQKALAAAAPLAIDRRAVKDSDGPPQRTLKPQLRVPAQDWHDGQLPGCLRVFLCRGRTARTSWFGAAVASREIARASYCPKDWPL